MTRCFETTGSVTRASEALDISFDTVKAFLKRLGYKTASNRLPPEKEEPIKQDYIHSDLDIKEMARKHGVKHDTIRKRAQKYGWKRLIWKRRYFREVWSRHMPKQEAEAKMAKVADGFSKAYAGSGNPMYGKPTPQGAGNGWKGWYRGHYFRSLREAMFMIGADKGGEKWEGGEKIKIPYTFNGVARTYRPDFIVGKTMLEIKPAKLHASPEVSAKQQAGRAYCEERGMEYRLIDMVIDAQTIREELDKGDIRFDRDYEARFRAILAKS